MYDMNKNFLSAIYYFVISITKYYFYLLVSSIDDILNMHILNS